MQFKAAALSTVLFFSFSAPALELIAGSLTYHILSFDGVSHSYSNKLSPDGRLIANALIGLRTVDNNPDGAYMTFMGFAGTNSVAKPMGGLGGSLGWWLSDRARAGLAYGFYVQDNQPFYDRGIKQVPGIVGGHMGILPVIGLEHTYFITKNLLTNVLISPIIGNLSIGWRF